MAKQALLKQDGVVTDVLPNTMFRVRLDNNHEILTTLSGKMKMHFIQIMSGDRVSVEMSPYDLTRGRITYRQRNTKQNDKGK
jgi:translation initiation factor IF-1